eukprot:TRINITY_DN19650_c0_g1_i5.p1 TRINITY_DN19650_c0_g1~~TRINITY_DN19650_c0_g1_i5.p1  ORF type:complete len:112 (-),score=19.37 TRINITY_DN19650_c0_g1_i5:83-418(-)
MLLDLDRQLGRRARSSAFMPGQRARFSGASATQEVPGSRPGLPSGPVAASHAHPGRPAPQSCRGIAAWSDKAERQLRCCLSQAVSYTHLRAHETPEHLVCRLLLEKKKKKT